MAAAGALAAGVAPLVLTLELDGQSFAAFDALRRRYYAPERNQVPAHVTLFRSLPGERAREIKAFLAILAADEKPLDIGAGEARATERGVAIFLKSARLHALRQTLAAEWRPWLTDQDRAGFRPHVTIMTTESEAEARRTMAEIGATFHIRRIHGVGLHLWRYLDGPWESERVFRFR